MPNGGITSLDVRSDSKGCLGREPYSARGIALGLSGQSFGERFEKKRFFVIGAFFFKNIKTEDIKIWDQGLKTIIKFSVSNLVFFLAQKW